jgi:hypothetical protein
MNRAIQQAIEKLIEDCPSCAGSYNFALRIVRELRTTTYVYNPDISDCAVAYSTPSYFRNIAVGHNAFDPNACCILASTLTHEAAHLEGASEDEARKIEKDCFNCPQILIGGYYTKRSISRTLSNV